MSVLFKGVVLAGGIGLGLAGAAQAASLNAVELLQQYNLITKGDVYSSQEVEGNVYIGGNLTGSTMQAGFVKSAVPDAGLANVVVLGNKDITLNLDPAVTVVIGGTNTGFINNVPAANVTVGSLPSGLVLDKAEVVSALDGWSAALAALPSSGSYVTGEQGYTFGAGVYNISLDDLSKMEFKFDLGEGETIVFNVSGTDLSLQKNWPGVDYGLGQQVVWNFYEATAIAINSKLIGSVLAPYATLSGFSGSLEGSVYASAVNLTNGEIHLLQPDFGDPELPSVPVPAGFPLLLGGLGSLAALRRKAA